MMKKTVMMIALFATATSAMAQTSNRENVSPNAPKISSTSQATVENYTSPTAHQAMLDQIMQHRSGR